MLLEQAVNESQTDAGRRQKVRGNLGLVRQIAGRLHRKFPWIDEDDLASYAYIGLSRAARAFDPQRSHCFGPYATVKGMYHAIDEMRRDGVLRRGCDTVPREEATDTLSFDVRDPDSDRPCQEVVDRDLCEFLLERLGPQDRRLLMLYYSHNLTFREISRLQGCSESAVCQRHKRLIARLRRVLRCGISRPAPARKHEGGAREGTCDGH